MAPFICCEFTRHPSPDVRPIRLVNNSQARDRFHLSTPSLTDTPASSGEAAASVHKIFEATASDEPQAGSFQAYEDQTTNGNFNVQRKESIKRIHGVANRIRKSISRDSTASKKSSRRNLRSSMGHQDSQRRREVKCALPTRVESDLLEDNKIDDDGEYDEDAVPMKTPRSTWGREQGATSEGNQHRLSQKTRESLSSVVPSHPESDRRDTYSQAIHQRSVTGILSQMLTVRGSSMNGNATSDEQGMASEETEATNARSGRSTTIKKYIFNDDLKSLQNLHQNSSSRTPSPLGRSDTVIRIPSSSAVVDLRQPQFLDAIGTQPVPASPDMQPQWMNRPSDSITGRNRRLSNDPSHRPSDCPQSPANLSNAPVNDADGDGLGQSIRANQEDWTHGASGMSRGQVYLNNTKPGTQQYKNIHSEYGRYCNPANDEEGLGEVDGNDARPPTTEYLKMPGACERKNSSGASSGSIHLFDMRIPQRLASQGLLPSVSLPYLQDFAISNDRIGTSDYHVVDGKARRRVSSSGFNSAKVPLAWGLPKKYAASSVYSQGLGDPNRHAASSVYSYDSPYITPTESQQSSMMFLNKIADRMKQFGPDARAQDIVSVPAANIRRVKLKQLERRTANSSFHSSNESLTNRELAAAQVRILPRAKTWNEPKSSWFKEDFADVAVAIASTNPQRRAVSEKLREKRSLSNFDGNDEQHLSIKPRGSRFSFVSSSGDEDQGASTWEKALNQHKQEDAAISSTRLGSDAMISSRNSLSSRHLEHRARRSQSPHRRHVIDRFAPQHKQEDTLQAKLGTYKLPTSPRGRRTPTEGLQPIPTTSSLSSWTRYSSHDREKRSSASAGEADNVFARDFAEEAASTARLARQDTGGIGPTATLCSPNDIDGRGRRKSKSMTFGRNVVAKLRKVYRVGSLEFASSTAFGSHGHRSSISEGQAVEYPELEMLAPRSPQMSVRNSPVLSLRDVDPVVSKPRMVTEELARGAESGARKVAERIGVAPEARTWSKMYVEDCVQYPTNSPPQGSVVGDAVISEDMRPVESPRKKPWKHESETDDVRKSTLDFKQSLEIDERRARERMLAMAVGKNVAS